MFMNESECLLECHNVVEDRAVLYTEMPSTLPTTQQILHTQLNLETTPTTTGAKPHIIVPVIQQNKKPKKMPTSSSVTSANVENENQIPLVNVDDNDDERR